MFKSAILMILICAFGSAFGQVSAPQDVSSRLPDYGGRKIRFTSPVAGQQVVAGDSLAIAVVVDDDTALASLFVVFPGGMIVLEPPFIDSIRIDESALGEMSLTALGMNTSGEMVASFDVAFEVVSGADRLLALEPPFGFDGLAGVGCASCFHIKGRYCSGIERDLTGNGALFSVVGGSDVVCVTEDGVVVGRRPGAAVVLVEYGGLELEVPVAVGDWDCGNNAPEARLPSLFEAEAGQEVCLEAPGTRDLDACLGEELDPELMRWKVEIESDVHEGSGHEFCFLPTRPGDGLIRLEVTDSHGATSWTVSMIEVR